MPSNFVDQLLDAALACHRGGDLAKADELYGQVLALEPTNPDAMHLRGVVAYQKGDFAQAIRAIEQALVLAPGNPTYLNNLGLCYRADGRWPEAIARFQAALQSEPQLAEAMGNVAALLCDQGRAAEAEDWCRRALALDPALSDAHNCLGSALVSQGRTAEGIASFRAALSCAPHQASAMVNLGAALRKAGQLEEAEVWGRRAVEQNPGLSEAHSALGATLGERGKVHEAIGCYREALRLAPHRAELHHSLGHAYGTLGRFDLAEQEYHAALRPAVPDVKTYYSFSLIHHFTPADLPLVSRMEAGLGGPTLTALDRRQLHFALGKAYDDLGEYDRAFPHFHAGNELARSPFDRRVAQRFVEELIRQFPRSRLVGSGGGQASQLPVFIVGMPRSGTSLVEQVLASHPQIHGCGELTEVNALAATFRDGRGELLPDTDPAWQPGQLAEQAAKYLRNRRESCGEAIRTTDKLPTNYLHLGLIALLFPGARVVHCRRDPRDTCVSCYFTDFRNSPAYCHALDDLGFCYRQYLRLMDHWREVLPLPMLEIQYEELVGDFAAVSRRMVEFCGVEWSEQCLRYREHARPVQTSSLWQVRQPIYRDSIGRWKHYVRHLEPLFRELASVVSS